MSSGRWNPEQREAIERRGRVFVAAGAGTGKTAVLVERVLQQVLGGTPIDRLLAITFTDRAASELRRRVREALELAGEMDRARAIDSAWISTIHRFCLRILRANAFDAGLDPRFAVADDVGSRLLRSEAFDLALERFLAEAPAGDGRRLDLLAAYGRRRLRETLSHTHEQLRSAGRPLELRPHAVADLSASVSAARRAAAELDHEQARRLAALLEAPPDPAVLADLSAYKVRNTAARQEYNAAREAVEGAAGDAAAVADLALLEELLRLVDARLCRAQGRAQPGRLHRPRAAHPGAPDRAAGPRGRLPRALRLRPGGRVPGHQPAPVRADRPRRRRRALPGRGRVPEHLPVPARRRRGVPGAERGGRSRHDRAAAQLPLPSAHHRHRQRELPAGVRRALPPAARGGRLRRRRAGRWARRPAADRQGGVRRVGTELARCRGAGAGRADRRAGRRRRVPSRPGGGAVRGRHRCRPLRGRAARPAPGHRSRDGARVLRPAAGVRRARLPAPACATATTTLPS